MIAETGHFALTLAIALVQCVLPTPVGTHIKLI